MCTRAHHPLDQADGEHECTRFITLDPGNSNTRVCLYWHIGVCLYWQKYIQKIGSVKVSFAEYSLFYRALLQNIHCENIHMIWGGCWARVPESSLDPGNSNTHVCLYCVFILCLYWQKYIQKIGSVNASVTYKRDDILQKRPIIVRSLLIVATAYSMNHWGPMEL